MNNPPSRQYIALVIFVAVLVALFFYSHREREPAAIPTAAPAASVSPPASDSGVSTTPPPAVEPVLPPQPERPDAAASSMVLFHPPGPPAGTRIEPQGSQYLRASTAAAKPGRAAVVDRASFARLGDLKAGDAVSIPLMDGRVVTGRVNLVQFDKGSWTRAGGELADGGGSFTLSSNGSAASGLILLKKEKIAYQLEEQKDGQLWMLEKPLSEVICEPLPREPEGMALAPHEGPAAAVPILNSRPGVKDVIYLDFDGETVTDPYWNNGNTIVASSFNLSTATINSIFDRVKEDWFPFNINVTTDVANYNGAQLGHRMRVIITPNDAAAPGAGGVAYLTSFRNGTGGGNFTSNIPCWVFNSSIVGISEAISHEVGHTMGLKHDGRENVPGHEEYYLGHGSGATSWCPIMGAGYYVNVVQWSKGEYTNANNQEDDLAIISASYNHFGYMVDDAGNTPALANALSGNPANGTINQVGLIKKTGDIDYYTFFTNGGPVTINAADPSSSPDLDIVLELQKDDGSVIATNNPLTALNASVSATLAQGQYYVKVSPTGAPTPPDTGYTNYASLGQYVLTGTVQGFTKSPIITSATTASGQVGVLFGFQIKASGNPASFGVQGTLPPGLALDSTTGSISGYPTQAGDFQVQVTATNASGTSLPQTLTISIADATLTLGEALDFPSLVWTTNPSAPWFGQKSVTKVDGDAAQAAQIGDGQETSFSTSVTGPVTLDFSWKVSSEPSGDFLVLQIDGTDTDQTIPISGIVDWVAVEVQIAAGSHTITWVYRKNADTSKNLDTAWVDGVSFISDNVPVITSSGSANGTVGVPFSYQITATNVPWSFAISSGTLPLGLSLDPETGLISGVPPVAGTTTVSVTATNNIGASDPFAVQIQIAASSTTVAQAVDDATAGTYTLATTQAGLNWFPETAVTHDSVDALQSGPIGPNQTVEFSKPITGFNTVNFWWKVESKPPGNLVRFFVDNVEQAHATGVQDWENKSIALATNGSHTIKWTYEKDSSGTLGADAAWVDQVVLTTDKLPVITSGRPPDGTQGVTYSYQITASNSPTSFSATGLPAGLTVSASGLISGVPTVFGNFNVTLGATNLAGTGTAQFSQVKFGPAPASLGDGVEAPQLVWSTSAARPWAVQTAFSSDSQDAAQSSPIAAGETSYIETQVTGPTVVSFRWNVESKQAQHFLRFAIDGAIKAQISGPALQQWELKSFLLDAGTHTLRWTYDKTLGTGSFGRDAGWLDTVTVDSSTTKPKITSPLTATAYLGRTFTYTIAATNGPDSYSAAPLPADLTLNGNVISGIPQAEGSTNVVLSASNTNGSGASSTLVLTVVSERGGADNFANATSLGGAAVMVEGNNAFATPEPGEPGHAGVPAHASLWYSWLAPLTGAVAVTTAGSEIDTVLSVYEANIVPPDTAPTFANLVSLKENDDAGSFFTSAVKFNAIAGHTYLIAVDGLNGTTGKVVLNIGYTASGLYTGLLVDRDHLAAPGLATIMLSAKFGFTGTILLGGQKIPLKPIPPQKAVFTGEDYSGFISRGTGVTPLQVALHIDLSAGAQEITGTVIREGVTYDLFANLGIGKKDLPPSLPGPFTFLIEPDDTTTAGGIGYGTASIDKTGNVKAAGTLGDGTKFTAGTHLAIDKTWILFLTPYKTTGGFVAGNVNVKQVDYEVGPPIKSIKTLSGNVSWQKGPDANPVFTGKLKGFQHDKTKPILTLNGAPATSLQVTFIGSDPAKPADFSGTLDAAFKFTGGPTGFTLKFTTNTGLFSGSLPDPNGGKAHPFGGAVINGIEFVSDNSGVVTQQPVSRGGGTFLGVNQAGAIELKPIP